MLGISKHRQAGLKTVASAALAGVQIGQAIISPETEWVSTASTPVYSLVPVGTAFSEIMYPVLATKYPTLVTPTLIAPEGSPYEYQIVADLQQGV